MAAKNILIVEDEKAMAKALELKLVKEGFQVAVAFDGEEALEAIKKNLFDLIILDLVMPKLDGFGVLEKLKSNKNTIPVVVCSNLGQPEDFLRARELGAIDYFVKSDISLKEVVKKIKGIFTT